MKMIINKFFILILQELHLLIFLIICLIRLIVQKNMIFLKKIWDFLKIRKKIWLYPPLFLFIIFATIIVLSQGSEITPFIYKIFE